MVCGTPVIAFRCGSVFEVLEDGTSGFIVNTIEEAVKAVKRVARLNRAMVRAQFERRFTVERMAHDYLGTYHRAAASSSVGKPTVAPAINFDAVELQALSKRESHRRALKSQRPKPGAPLADDFAIDRLLKRGVVFGVCNMALQVQGKMPAGNAGVTAEEAAKVWVASLIPGIKIIPSGTWGANRVREMPQGFDRLAAAK